MGRTLHGIGYNSVTDEILVGNPLAASVLVFRGAASGNEAPVRVIQGPKTRFEYPHSVAVDVKNQEILVIDPTARSILVFPWNANGDVAPKRVLKGPNTKLRYIVSAAVDPDRDLLIVSTSAAGVHSSAGAPVDGLVIFNRTDSGDVAPRAIIAGPKTGIGLNPWQLEVHQGKIYAAISNVPYTPLYSGIKPRVGLSPDTKIMSPWLSERVGFIGVWNTTDNGDIPPLAIIKGPGSGLIHAGGLALNPKHKEIFAVDSVRNGLLTFLVPEFFGQRK